MTYKFQHLVIETTRVCNAKCTYCLIHREDMTKDEVFMDFELAKHIVDITPYSHTVWPYSRGEPMLYPDLIPLVHHIKSNRRKAKMYTNGSLFSPWKAYELMVVGLDEVSFSIDTDSPKAFQDLRGLDWDVVFGNVRDAVDIRDRYGFDTKIFIRACYGPWNAHRTAEITQFWEQYVDGVHWMPYIDFPSWAEMQPKFTKSLPIFCNQPFNQSMTVSVDGSVTFCCNDWYRDYTLGKITLDTTEKELLEMWNSEVMTQWRNGLLTGINAPTVCVYCNVVGRMRDMHRRMRGNKLLYRDLFDTGEDVG